MRPVEPAGIGETADPRPVVEVRPLDHDGSAADGPAACGRRARQEGQSRHKRFRRVAAVGDPVWGLDVSREELIRALEVIKR